jgi:hypothetical protein
MEILRFYFLDRAEKWHWCTNCPHFPPVVVQIRRRRPQSGLCQECQSRETAGSCTA